MQRVAGAVVALGAFGLLAEVVLIGFGDDLKAWARGPLSYWVAMLSLGLWTLATATARRVVFDRATHTAQLTAQAGWRRTMVSEISFKDIRDIALAPVTVATRAGSETKYQIVFLLRDGSHLEWTKFPAFDVGRLAKIIVVARAFGEWDTGTPQTAPPTTATLRPFTYKGFRLGFLFSGLPRPLCRQAGSRDPTAGDVAARPRDRDCHGGSRTARQPRNNELPASRLLYVRSRRAQLHVRNGACPHGERLIPMGGQYHESISARPGDDSLRKSGALAVQGFPDPRAAAPSAVVPLHGLRPDGHRVAIRTMDGAAVGDSAGDGGPRRVRTTDFAINMTLYYVRLSGQTDKAYLFPGSH